MSKPMTIDCAVHFNRRSKGHQELQVGEAPDPACAPGRVPRVAKLLALAHRFDGLVRDGQVPAHADLARLGQVTRARVSQIMNLLQLAPDIQEAILFLPRIERGRDPIRMHDL